jgi:transcription-repair coupling factor (superfamily II helicase)
VLRDALERVIGSEPFERLLLEKARPVLAHAETASDVVVAALAASIDAPVLAVAPGPREAEALASGIEAYLGPDLVALLPAWEALPYEGISPAAEIAARRASAIARLRSAAGAFVIVAPPLAAMQGIIPSLGAEPSIRLETGGEVAPDVLGERLVELGYARVDLVEHRGEFASRGGVLDVFPGTARRPVRMEFYGDTIESMREFMPSTQLSTKPVDGSEVSAVRELIADARVRELAAAEAPKHTDRIAETLYALADGLHPEGVESLAPLIFGELQTPAGLLEPGSWVVVTEAERTGDRARQAHDEASSLADAIAWPGPPAVVPLADALGDRVRLDLSSFTQGIDLGLARWGTAQANAAELAAQASELASRGFRLIVSARGHGSLDRAKEVFGSTEAQFVESSLQEGFVFDAGKIAVATEEDIFGSRRHTRTAPRFTGRRTDAIADELEPGDFAVHRIHGVGRYTGISHRELAGAERDYIVLEYAQGDKLFVPTDQVGMVARYLGGETPRLHRLGGSDWARTTARVKRAVRDMAGELVRLYSVRMAVPGYAFGPDTPWQAELEDAFAFVETGDQLTAIEDVKKDMESSKPMDRLICGDVGFGKTEIALRAAFKAVMDGKQVAVLVPTTLLAEQHFITFSERYAPFPVTVKMLSRFVPATEQKQILEELASGKIDLVIGTHRLIGKDVKFKDLGLLIVDEEQRFGVSHKEQLKKLRAHVDVLTMTATPIPRTLEMALTGIREMSTIDTPPEDRQPVLTYVGSYDEGLALGAVRRELLREGQVFWVHNRVATIDRQAAWLQEEVPEARIVIAHGQMDEAELEKQMIRFWDREADILVCSTIIESGLDVPNANTLIIDGAHLLGLAQLYQLRGRVGRSTERAFAYFFFPPQRRMTEEAHERLATIAKHQALGSGFQIALRDLEIRGAGNILGAEQHGHIAAVGFDTYARILAQSVAEMKGDEIAPEKELRIELPVKAFVPPGWIQQEALRLELYRRISLAADHATLARIRDETIDRYGALPEPVRTLFGIASLRATGLRLGIEEISTYKEQVRLSPLRINDTLLLDLGERIPKATYHLERLTLNLVPERVYGTELVAQVESWLREAVGEEPEPGLAGEFEPSSPGTSPDVR